MRWKRKIKEYKHVGMVKCIPKPNIGDRKEVVKFALFPTKLDKENIIWLERYIELYEYKKFKVRDNANFNKFDMSEHYISVRLEIIRKRECEFIEKIDWKLIEKKFYN